MKNLTIHKLTDDGAGGKCTPFILGEDLLVGGCDADRVGRIGERKSGEEAGGEERGGDKRRWSRIEMVDENLSLIPIGANQ